MAAGEDGYFRRFRFDDADLDEVRREIAADQATAAEGMDASPALVAALVRLGFLLIPVGREAEAVGHLEAGLAMARQLGEHGQEISALLHLATAYQYLGERDRAQALFQQGLDKAAEYGIDDERHYLLHHRGRCYAEQGRLREAHGCLAEALALRQQTGPPRLIASSQDALADLARMSEAT